jgi:hypothetical protein
MIGMRASTRALSVIAGAIGLSLVAVPVASAKGGHYVFDGGTAHERQQVVSALDVSAFNWSVVPWTVTIRIRRADFWDGSSGGPNGGYASRKLIVLDSALLDRGDVSWGYVQHEYAHQVDLSRFNDAIRRRLTYLLVGRSWWTKPGRPHAMAASERFASTLAWTYWPSPQNALGDWNGNESHAMLPGPFKKLMRSLLGCC